MIGLFVDRQIDNSVAIYRLPAFYVLSFLLAVFCLSVLSSPANKPEPKYTLEWNNKATFMIIEILCY